MTPVHNDYEKEQMIPNRSINSFKGTKTQKNFPILPKIPKTQHNFIPMSTNPLAIAVTNKS